MRGIVRWIPAVACMGAIFWLSSLPKTPHIPFLSLFVFDGDYSDKLRHAVAYAVLGGSFWWVLSASPPRRRIVLVVALAVLYGLTDEWHQNYVKGRHPDALDLAADAFGAAVAAVGLTVWLGGRRHGKEVGRE